MKMIIHRPRICVIGLGEIGGSVFAELLNHRDKFEIIGVDINPARFDTTLGDVEYSTEPVPADYYIVSVWTMDQILAVLEKIGPMMRTNPGLISIESTLDLSRMDEFFYVVTAQGLLNRVVTMPHRWNPGDAEHGVFNQPRVLGGIFETATLRGREFYSNFMKPELIHTTDFYTAAVSKVAENAYRAMEIILAQELKRTCEAHALKFEELQKAMNTKWNIDVRDARDGVRGKCLPKDLAFFCEAFPENVAARVLQGLNEEYKKRCDAENS